VLTGAGIAASAVDSIALGGSGALVIAGVTLPPMGAIFLGAAVGATSVGSLVCLVIKLWESGQTKALAYLNEILTHLHELKQVNTEFLYYLNDTEKCSNRVLAFLEPFKASIRSQSPRFRRANSEICLHAIVATGELIKSIEKISDIDLDKWFFHNVSSTRSICASKPNKHEEAFCSFLRMIKSNREMLVMSVEHLERVFLSLEAIYSGLIVEKQELITERDHADIALALTTLEHVTDRIFSFLKFSYFSERSVHARLASFLARVNTSLQAKLGEVQRSGFLARLLSRFDTSYGKFDFIHRLFQKQ
jgi:hypothetical protein